MKQNFYTPVKDSLWKECKRNLKVGKNKQINKQT